MGSYSPPCLLSYKETHQPVAADIEARRKEDPAITHVAMVHGETTTGILNPIAEVSRLVKGYGRTMIIDAMSTFGGIPLEVRCDNSFCINDCPGMEFLA